MTRFEVRPPTARAGFRGSGFDLPRMCVL